ncbi:hypothetical protein SELMODRAFT_104027 [Selaginella moellendorffii]|uniref:Pentacotripeptide-repeat region of PRORP domain-containing protein n=1 Tax=Selaginella moellendorffii TaxID=88036 RepID=D8RWZ6_SELML|nr:hypothetical protein SELMODRAFT_104027 [Selaginella moellendorffii]
MPCRNLVSWNAKLTAHAKRGHLEESKALFDRMPERDVVSWTAMLSAYSQNHNLSKSKQIFDDMPCRNLMRNEGFSPDEAAFTCVLLSCIHKGNVKIAHSFFYSMIFDHGLSASKQQFGCVIDTLGRAGHLWPAEDLIRQMPFEPIAKDWICFMGACNNHKNVDAAARAAQCALDLDRKGAATYVLLRNVYCEKP